MSEFEKRVEFYPAFDKRSSDPNKNYGIGGVGIRFLLIGEKGAIQFRLSTRWYLPHVQSERDAKELDHRWPYDSHKPMPTDLGYHSYVPLYEGQTPMDGECDALGCTCYYDGSSLAADDVFQILLKEGHEGVWKELEQTYEDRFREVSMEDIAQCHT